MSKKKGKDKKDAPMDYQLATKNLQYTIVVKDTDIDRLKNENNSKMKYILSLEDEISKLRSNAVNAFDLQYRLKKALAKNEALQKEVDNFNNNLLEVKKKYEEEKKRLETTYKSEINHLRVTMDAFIEKVRLTNQLITEKKKLEKDLEDANNKNKEIMIKNNENLTEMKVRNEIKFSTLKKKMTENIQKTKIKVTDLNLQYMDVSSKLTLLQNHQLLIQLEYQTQQVDDLKQKIKILEKQIFNLSKENEIHKEVELSLAEKNKTLRDTVEKSKSNNKSITSYKGNKGSWREKSNFISTQNLNTISNIKNINTNTSNENNFNEENNNDNKVYRKTISFKNLKNNNKSTYNSNSIFNSNIIIRKTNGSLNFNNVNNEQSRIINLEKKVINLEKKLISTKKDYNDLKDKNEFIERVLQNYENKYSGLFKFLEECLNKFYNDEELKNNKEIYVNIESIQKGDFSSLNKEEKYSTLIILMKYLMPLMNSKNLNDRNNNIDNINIKYHEFNITNKNILFTNKKIKRNKKFIMNTTNNFYNSSKKVKINKIINKNDKNELDPLPSITKMNLTGSHLLLNKSLNKNRDIHDKF